jgi:hypothetical protein
MPGTWDFRATTPLEAVKVYATIGEICDTLRDVFGEHQETVVLLGAAASGAVGRSEGAVARA